MGNAIVLAGGRSARMGSDKAAATLAGEPLVARAVAACSSAELVVVVAPPPTASLVDDRRVVVTLEDPPFGGPVAGIEAGVRVLRAAPDDSTVFVLACDLPFAAEIVSLLLRSEARRKWTDALLLVDEEGWPQYLAGLYRLGALRAALRRLGRTREASVRQLMAPLRATLIDGAHLTRDVDDPQAASSLGIRLAGGG